MKANVSLRLKRSLIAILVVLFLAAICGFGLLKFDKNQNVLATEVSAPTAEDEVIDAGGMTMHNSASIRLSGNAIRFSATVSRTWHEDTTRGAAEAVYFATMNAVGSDDVKAVKFGVQPNFGAGDTEYILNTYLKFENASAEVLKEALTTEFETAVYLRVTRASTENPSENNVYFYKAVGSNEVERSMRAVANSSWLNWKEGQGYTQEDLLDMGYFTPTFRSEDDYAVVSTDDTLYVNMPGAPETISEIYVDDVKVETESYTVANFKSEGKYITVFDENGKAYSTTFDTGYTTIANRDEFVAAFPAGSISAEKYALISDVTIGAWAGIENGLSGTLNGLGYSLKDIKVTGGSHSALIKYAQSCTVKNINAFHNGTWANHTSLLFGLAQNGTISAPSTNYIKNSFFYAPNTGYNSALLVSVVRRNNNFNIDNCAFIVDKADTTLNGIVINVHDGTAPSAASNPGYAGTFTINNSVCVTGGNATKGFGSNTGSIKGGTTILNNLELYKTILDGEFEIPNNGLDRLQDFESLVILNNENITKLQTATKGVWVLEEDIDMWQYTNSNSTTVWAPTSTFSGVFDGIGYSFKNIAGNASGTYAGIFSKLNGATVRNVGFEAYATLKRGLVASQILGTTQTVIENIAIRADVAQGSSCSPIAGVIQNAYVIRDSIIAVGYASGYNANYVGILSGGDSTNGKPVVENVVVLNRSNIAGLTGNASSALAAGQNYATKADKTTKAVEGEDYFMYSTGEELFANMNNKTFVLPESVIDLAYDVDILHELNASNIKDLQTARGCGYWYLTEDVDMKTAGAQSWSYASNSMKDAYYRNYVNIEIDGRGHKLTNFTTSGSSHSGILSQGAGGTLKNIYIHYIGSAGSSYSSYTFSIARPMAYDNSCVETYNFENLFLEFDSFDNRNGGIFVGFADGPATVNVTNVFIKINGAVTNNGYRRLFFGHNLTSTSTATFKKCFVVGITDSTIPLSKDGTTIKDSTGTAYVLGTYNSDIVFASSLADLQALNDGSDWNFILSAAYGKVTDLNYEYFGVCHIHTASGDWVETIPSSCDKYGTKVQKCVRCGDVAISAQIEELDPDNHTNCDWVVEKEATCGEEGYKVLKCNACAQEVERKEIDATGLHIDGEWVVSVEPTCAVEGTEVLKCAVCGEEFKSKPIAPTREHVAGAWEVAVEPTKEQEGKLVRVCSGVDCDYIFEEKVVEKLTNDVDFDLEDFLGEDHDHVLGDWVVEEDATCGKDGLKVKRCSVCDKAVEKEVIPATLEHVESDWIIVEGKEATCVADGERIKKCTTCGQEIVHAIYSDPENHKASDWIEKVPASCANGLEIKECTLCQKQLDERVTAPTGEHVIPEGDDKWVIKTEATCVDGLKVKYCDKNCGTIVEKAPIPADKDHIESGVWEIYVSPSCSATGTEVQKCTTCDGIVLSKELAIDPNAHVMGTWVVNENGEKERLCVICGEVVLAGEGLAKTEMIALNKGNITDLLTATSGYYYLTEDIDMAEVCANGAWNSAKTFTGTLDGRGYTLRNFRPGSGSHQGLFFRLGNGAVIKDLAVRITNCGYRVGFIGQVVGGLSSKVLIERVSLYYEDMSFANFEDNVSYEASGFVHVPQADVLLKDCFAYIAQSDKFHGAYTGYLFGGEADTINPRVENVYVMSVGKGMQSPIGTSGSVEVIVTNTNYQPAVEGTDYFHYSTPEELAQAFANGEITLPASVIEQMANLGVFSAHDCVAGENFVTYIAPTCAVSGVEARLCVTCGAPVETRAISKLPHVIETEWHLGAESTCADAGYNYKKCLTCGEIISKKALEINPDNHVNLTWEMVNGVMTGTCSHCGVIGAHQMTVPTYHNTETETFSIWAYGATPGKWISWEENGVKVKYWLLPTGEEGAVQYVLEADFPYYYYDESGMLKKSETPVSNCVTENDAVYMTSTTENGTLDVYAAANFNTLFYTFGIDFSYSDFEGSFAEEVFDWAADNGMQVFAQGGLFHQMAAQKTPLVDPEHGTTYVEGMTVVTETKFKTQGDLNRFAIYELRNVIYHPAFKGVTFIDEPTWDMFVAMGELAQAVKAAEDYYGREIYVMENLVPYANSEHHFRIYNGIGLTGYEAFEYYLNTYYENVGKYLGYVQYDDYPLRVAGYAGDREIIQYYIKTHQFTSEWAKEKGIDRAMAVQSYGDREVWSDKEQDYVDTGRRGCTPEDILWQMNISAAFGCKDFSYYTYFPIINTGKGVDDNGEEFIVNRDGEKTKSYAGVQQANAELLHKGRALMNFEYQDMKIFTSYSTANGANKDDCYFFAGCGKADCAECACINGTLKYVDGATVNFGRGAVLITELIDEETGYRGYYVVNITDPLDMISGSVTIDISDLFNSVQIYKGTEVTNQTLVNGQITIELGVGDGAFIIPFNA